MWSPWRLLWGDSSRSDSAESGASRRPAAEIALRRVGARRRLRGRRRLPRHAAQQAVAETRAPARAAPSEAPRPKAEPAYVHRFDAHQRLQHIVMLSTFTACAVSGLPQKFPDLAASRWWVELLGGIDNVRTIHHWAAYVMLGDCLYHVAYLVFRVGVQGRVGALRMIPTPKDFEDAANMFLYYLGARDEKPKFGRFTYLEKFDYWAVFWGIAMIGGSGLILLFPVFATRILPGHILPTAHAIHSDEAVLATGWIFIAHIFYVHLSPRSFPINTSMFSGRMRRDHYKEEHPLEYERLVGQSGEDALAPVAGGALDDAHAGTTRRPAVGSDRTHLTGG